MKKEFAVLYQALERSLQEISKTHSALDLSRRSIEVIRESIVKIMDYCDRDFGTQDEEIEFFRDVWPTFYGKLFFYIKIHKFEIDRQFLPGYMHAELISSEEVDMVTFFREHSEFAYSYKSASPLINELFTRQNSLNVYYEDLAMVIDWRKCTLASYHAAWCLANSAFKQFLEREKSKDLHDDNEATTNDYTWAPSDADFVEWLAGLHSIKAIKYKGEPANITRLQKWAKLALNKEIVNFSDRFKVIRSRKKDRIPFTKQISSALEKRMDEADGKYD